MGAIGHPVKTSTREASNLKRALRGMGLSLMVAVRVAVGLGDAVVAIALFAAGNIGAAIVFLLIGVPVTFFIAKWVAPVVAAPFLIAGEPMPAQATSIHRTAAPRQAEREYIDAVVVAHRRTKTPHQVDRDHVDTIVARVDTENGHRRTKTPRQAEREYIDAVVVAHRRTKTSRQAELDYIDEVVAANAEPKTSYRHPTLA